MKRLLFVVLLLSVPLTESRGQSNPDLEKLDERIVKHFQAKMPEWRHKRGEPIQGSTDMLVERLALSNRTVKISVVPHNSVAEAREAIERFVRYDSEKEQLQGFGDQAFAWGYGLGNVVFRRGKYAVFISVYADVYSDADARTLDTYQRGQRERAEMKRLSREFAKHVTNAIDGP
jgi:hypothetical protein